MRIVLLVSIIVFGIALFCIPVQADTYAGLTADCVTLCNAEDYAGAYACFKKDRDPPSAYLAVATCAFNAGKDTIAEDYALKAASSNMEWVTFLNKFGYTVIRTGGLGETYVLAYVASGGARHKDKAIQYLKTSGQCQKSDDKDLCAEQYFNNVVMQYQQRNIQGARVAYAKPTVETIHGLVTDHYGKPLKYAKINYKCGALDNIAYTDESGSYMINFSKTGTLDSPTDICTNGKLYLKLSYTDPSDNKTYFRILTSGEETYVWRQLNIQNESDLKQDFSLKQQYAPGKYQSPTNPTNLEDRGVMYFHMSEAVDFYKNFLKANIDYKLPVDVISHQTAEATQYSPTTGTIYIHLRDSSYTSANKPKNREWHEFSHHVMYSLYGQWPGPENPPWERNHNGYANPSTADSFSEAFAEFMPLVIAEHYHYPSPEVYPVGGSLEQDWKAWSARGFYEELALAGALWDVYDVSEEANDTLQMRFEDIWSVLKTYNKDFTEVYEELGRQFPKNKDLLKKIWIAHGIYVENKTGNGIYDADEPFVDLNGNRRKGVAEPFIDLADNTTHRMIVYDDNEKAGSAANYQRLARRSATNDPARNIKVNNNIPTYKVVVKFTDHPEWSYEVIVDNNQGMVNVPMPDEEYKATVTIIPEGIATNKPLTITNEAFSENLERSAEQEYYVEHDFGVGNVDIAERAVENVPARNDIPYWDYHEKAQPADYVYKEFQDVWAEGTSSAPAGKSKSVLPWIIAVIVLVVAIVLLLKFRKKKKKH
ncbi:MAG: hypothetical protein V1725_03110 [archaeon]